jgi:hypothetical protein
MQSNGDQWAMTVGTGIGAGIALGGFVVFVLVRVFA